MLIKLWRKIDNFLSNIYRKCDKLAGTKYALGVLMVTVFANSSFFPIPPEPLYIAMCLRNKKQIWRLAFLATVMASIGGYLGYMIGSWLYDSVGCYIVAFYGSQESFEAFRMSLRKWGFWIIIAKGMMPIPYKIVAIGAGLAGLDLLSFTIASLIGRAIHFFYVGFAIWYLGDEIKEQLDKNFGKLFLLGLAILGIFIWYINK